MSALKKPSDDLTGFVAGFLAYLRAERRASAYTQRNYAQTLERFSAFLPAHLGRIPNAAALEGLETADFRAYLASRRADGVSAASIRLDLSALRSFFKFLRAREGIDNDAISIMRGPKLKERLPRPVSAEAAADLIEAAETREDRAPWLNARDAAIFTLLYGAGLRISEALSLQRRDAPPGEFLRIDGKGGKTRLAPVLPAVRQAITAYADLCPHGAAPGDPLFYSTRGKPLSARQVQREMKILARRLGLPESATPHALRHAFATHMLSGGGDLRAVQELLGHASIKATQRYTKIEAERLTAVHRAAHPRAE